MVPGCVKPRFDVDLALAAEVDDEHVRAGGQRLDGVGEVVMGDALDDDPDLPGEVAATNRGHDHTHLAAQRPTAHRSSLNAVSTRGTADFDVR